MEMGYRRLLYRRICFNLFQNIYKPLVPILLDNPILEYLKERQMLAAGYIVSLLASIVSAAPGFELAQLSKRQSITTLSPAQISSFKPFTSFASAAYCDPSTTINWSCHGTFFYLFPCKIQRLIDHPYNSRLCCKLGLHPYSIRR